MTFAQGMINKNRHQGELRDHPREQNEIVLEFKSQMVTIGNTQGLHMRPVMSFVDTASRYQSAVRVKKGDFEVDGKNPMEMILLEATQGTQLEIRVEGSDADDALGALTALVTSGFGET